MKNSFLILFLLSVHFAFGQLETGAQIDSVHCTDDYSQSYALYLPSNYSDESTWPIVYFFEPGARGWLPVKNYRLVAEEFGVILVCTNNSRNGPWEPSFEAADAVFLDTKNRLSIDSDQYLPVDFQEALAWH